MDDLLAPLMIRPTKLEYRQAILHASLTACLRCSARCSNQLSSSLSALLWCHRSARPRAPYPRDSFPPRRNPIASPRHGPAFTSGRTDKIHWFHQAYLSLAGPAAASQITREQVVRLLRLQPTIIGTMLMSFLNKLAAVTLNIGCQRPSEAATAQSCVW